MKIIHTGLGAGSEEKADHFFIDILGFEKSGSKTLDKKLTQAIFGINKELLVINYLGGETAHYEILVYQGYKAAEKQLLHSCIEVDDLANIVDKCKDAGLKIVKVPKGAKVITFISDYDGNLFELKEQQSVL
jgi:catechol 2,3-dioxygenase-like lactoylglutathione lyase family enzyme